MTNDTRAPERRFHSRVIDAAIRGRFSHYRLFRFDRFGKVVRSDSQAILGARSKFRAESISDESILNDHIGKMFSGKASEAGSLLSASSRAKKPREFTDPTGSFLVEASNIRFLLPVFDSTVYAVIELQLGKTDGKAKPPHDRTQLAARLRDVANEYTLAHQEYINSSMQRAIRQTLSQLRNERELLLYNFEEFIFGVYKEFLGIHSMYRTEGVLERSERSVQPLHGSKNPLVEKLLNEGKNGLRTLRSAVSEGGDTLFLHYDPRTDVLKPAHSDLESSATNRVLPNVMVTANVSQLRRQSINIFAWEDSVELRNLEKSLVSMVSHFHTNLAISIDEANEANRKSNDDIKTLTMQKIDREYQSARHAIKGAANASRLALDKVSSFLARRYEENKTATRDISNVKKRLDIIETRVEQIGGFSPDRLEEQLERKSIRSIIEDARNVNAPTMKMLGVKWQVSGTAKAALVYETLLLDVFHNLILNSLDAYAARQSWLSSNRQITVNVSDSGPSIRVSYVDTAGGIRLDDDEQTKPISKEDANLSVFREKYTTKAAGTGYGMYLASTYIDVHNGSLAVENNSENGVEFAIFLSKNPKTPGEAALRL